MKNILEYFETTTEKYPEKQVSQTVTEKQASVK